MLWRWRGPLLKKPKDPFIDVHHRLESIYNQAFKSKQAAYSYPLLQRTVVNHHLHITWYQVEPTMLRLTKFPLRNTRLFTRTYASSMNRPAPIPLPPKEQRDFEELQKNASAPRVVEGGEVHPDIRTKPPPDFQGDRNPKTGEVNGPKHDPLR